MQGFTVTALFAGQHNTKLHGTITGDIQPLIHQFKLQSGFLYLQFIFHNKCFVTANIILITF